MKTCDEQLAISCACCEKPATADEAGRAAVQAAARLVESRSIPLRMPLSGSVSRSVSESVMPMIVPVIDMGALPGYKADMVLFIVSLLVAALAALPVWAIADPAEALVTIIVLTLALWPPLALAMRVVEVIIALLGEAITNRRARG